MANIIPRGKDESTGQSKIVGSGDMLVDSTGSPITGLQGNTGIMGNAGSQGLQGVTGIGAGGSGASQTMWFVTNNIVAATFLAPFGVNSGVWTLSNGIRTAVAGTISLGVFHGNTSSVDYLIQVNGSGGFNTGFVSDGGQVSPNLAVSVGDRVTINIVSIGSGSEAAFTLLIT